MKDNVLAVDIGGTKTQIAVVSSDYKIKEMVEFKTATDYIKTIGRVKTEIDKFDPEKKLPIGIAICGLLSLDVKGLLFAPNLKWKNTKIRELFGPLKREFFIGNDGTLAAWASYITEVPKDIKNHLSITLGTGVGGGIIINDNLLFGAGELGHIKIASDGPKCNCLKYGCLESFVGGKHIPKRAGEWFELDIGSAKELFDLAEGGHLKAIKCWEKIGNILGRALSGVVNLCGIQSITIGGKITSAKKYFLKSLKDSLFNNLMAPDFQECKFLFQNGKTTYL